jgi:solute:Na+ symporter, SSS family
VGRIVTVGLFACAAGLTFVLDTAKDAFDIILQIGAGTGLLYLLRWFWWRINAWCEVAAMVSSFGVSILLLILHKSGHSISAHIHGASLSLDLPITIVVTTICWVVVAFAAPETDQATLIDFYKKVRPFGPGWRRIRLAAGITEAECRATHENIPLALLGWSSGCAVIWSGLFTLGSFLYGRTNQALLLLVTFIAGGFVLLYVVRRLWAGTPAPSP